MVLWGTVWGGGSFTDTSEVSVTNYTCGDAGLGNIYEHVYIMGAVCVWKQTCLA